MPSDTTAASQRRYLRRREAAAYLQVSASFLAKAAVSGGGPAYSKFGRAVVYDQLDLDRFAAEHRRANTSELIPAKQHRQPRRRLGTIS